MRFPRRNSPSIVSILYDGYCVSEFPSADEGLKDLRIFPSSIVQLRQSRGSPGDHEEDERESRAEDET